MLYVCHFQRQKFIPASCFFFKKEKKNGRPAKGKAK